MMMCWLPVVKVATRVIMYLLEEEEKSSPITPVSKVITFIGATGAGKSSTINSLLGYSAFPVGATHGTSTVVAEQTYLRGYQLRDTPGLMDSIPIASRVWEAIQDSELVIYVTRGQLYRVELELVKRVYDSQRMWESSTLGDRRLALYVNAMDIKEQSMTSASRIREAEVIQAQVAKWIEPDHIVFGCAAPTIKGRKKKAQIKDLKALIQIHIDAHM